MKRLLTLSLILCLFFTLCGCQKTMYTTEDLITKAREEFSVSGAESMDISYAGMCTSEPFVLMWFISGNENQAHSHLLMECSISDHGGYIFERTYQNLIDRGN